jgi:hypothetical protein
VGTIVIFITLLFLSLDANAFDHLAFRSDLCRYDVDFHQIRSTSKQSTYGSEHRCGDLARQMRVPPLLAREEIHDAELVGPRVPNGVPHKRLRLLQNELARTLLTKEQTPTSAHTKHSVARARIGAQAPTNQHGHSPPTTR